MVTLRLLAVEISPTSAICRNSMLIHNSSSYNLSGGLFLSSWIVQLKLSLLLIGLSKGMCSSTPSLERLIGNSLIFRLGSSQCTV